MLVQLLGTAVHTGWQAIGRYTLSLFTQQQEYPAWAPLLPEPRSAELCFNWSSLNNFSHEKCRINAHTLLHAKGAVPIIVVYQLYLHAGYHFMTSIQLKNFQLLRIQTHFIFCFEIHWLGVGPHMATDAVHGTLAIFFLQFSNTKMGCRIVARLASSSRSYLLILSCGCRNLRIISL